MARRRRGRKRSKLTGTQPTSGPMNPELVNWIVSSVGQQRKKQEHYRRLKDDGTPGQREFEEAAKKTVEIFVGNVSHGTKAADLVKYFQNKALSFSPPSTTSTEASILRCQLKKTRSTFAFVTVRSIELAEALQNCASLVFGGRKLTVKPAKARFQRPMGTAPGFTCGGLQLCAEWPPGELTCLWAVKSEVTFQVSRTSSLASLKFKDERDMDGMADFKRRHVDGEVELANHAERTWLVFRLLRPPFLSGHEKSWASRLVALADALRDESVWELNNDAKLKRVGDLSPNGFFGRCLVYRLDVSQLLKNNEERARLFRQLHAFRLCTGNRPREDHLRFPLRVNMHLSGQPLDGWSHLPKYHDLPYRVKFLIECLVSNLKFDALALDEKAIALLTEVDEERASLALSAMLGSDPRARLESLPSEEIMKWLGGLGPEVGTATIVGSGNVMITRASVTPLRVVCQPPEPEVSSGVTRHFARYSDRFLRVNFVDENMGRLPLPLSDSLARRLDMFLREGLTLAGRKYDFLAYSSSQLRGHSCFFYAGGGGGDVPSVKSIRRWMGDMSGIDVVGKRAAKYGQSLSSTTSTLEVRPEWRMVVPDKSAGPYEFTDGCGMMSEDLARDVANMLGHNPNERPPSAFQIRMGGCKGMLAVWPDTVMERVSRGTGCKVLVWQSMKKFPSNRNTLEVIQCARRLPFYLKRQLITLLSTLDVPDDVIEEHHDTMLQTLDKMVCHRVEAEKALLRYNTASGERKGRKQVGPLWEALAMVRAGFDVAAEPFLQGMLRATRDKAMIDLRHRTRIFVPHAACFLGIVDETGTLPPGQVYFSSELPAGIPILVCRNPSLHPGDLRVLKTAGNLPQLRHLIDVVVFSREGDRPEPSKMSGGDLDGDLYAVVWDQDLLPPRKRWGDWNETDENTENGWNYPAMGYEPPEKPPTTSSSGEGGDIQEITDFFLNYIRNDNLGVIANAHLAFADASEDGARCKECLQLASLFSRAVDFPKSGVPAVIPMLIGRLFRKTSGASFTNPNPREREDLSGRFEVDASLLVTGWEDFVAEAEVDFGEYVIDVMSLANKYGVVDEGQLISGQVERFGGRMLKRSKLEDAQGRLNAEFAQIKAKYRAKFQEQNYADDNISPDADYQGESEEGGMSPSDKDNTPNDDSYGWGIQMTFC
eukprot:g5899.t2